MTSNALRHTCLLFTAALLLATGAAAQPRSGPAQSQALTGES
ncbi:MAG TPA: hypothetical protein VJ725_09160 [Thermoanaerobaculia bacterium]|nr:hypothetical protein [Thermoanaerobaculia bacterium]